VYLHFQSNPRRLYVPANDWLNLIFIWPTKRWYKIWKAHDPFLFYPYQYTINNYSLLRCDRETVARKSKKFHTSLWKLFIKLPFASLMGHAVVTLSRSVIVWFSFIFKSIVWCCVDGTGFTMTTIATDKHTFKVYCTTQPEKPSAARMYLAGISQSLFSAKKQFNKYFVRTLHLSM